MTSSPVGRGEGAAGTVFDIGYQRYSGPREGRRRARWALLVDGVRVALGIGRGPRSKALPWTFIIILVGMGFVMALVAGAALRLVGPGAEVNLPSHAQYYGISSMIFVLFAAVVAPELLCPDRRDGVLNLYLVRPITGADYILARWAAFMVVSVVVAWLPQVVLMIGLVMGNPEPIEYLQANWTDLPRILAAGAALAAFTTTLAMTVASFTTRRAYASVMLVGLVVVSTPFTLGLGDEIGGSAGQWIAMFNLAAIPVHMNDLIFGATTDITSVADANLLPARLRIGWYLLWVLGPGALLYSRYRKVKA